MTRAAWGMWIVDAAALINLISDWVTEAEGYPTIEVAMITHSLVSGKRRSASTVSDEEPTNKLRKTGRGSRMTTTSKELKLTMFKRPKPIISLDQMLPLGVLERLVNFLDVVNVLFCLFSCSLNMLWWVFLLL